jgi:hypothetical protein
MQRKRALPLRGLGRGTVTLIFVLALLLPCIGMQSAKAAPALVRSNSNALSGAASISTSLASTPTVDDLLILVCSTGLSRTVTTPAGFTVAKTEAGTPTQYIFYKKSVGSETSATCTFSSSANVVIQYYEYSGMHGYMTLDAVNTVASTGNSVNISSGTVTTTHPNDLIFASIVSDDGPVISAWSNSFTARQGNGKTGGSKSARVWAAGADFTATSNGSYSTVATASLTSNWRGQIVAFRSLASPLVLGADIVDASGVGVSSPTVDLSSLGFAFGCQSSTGTLGTSEQRIRITNNTDNPAWTLSLAATDGPTALYSSGDATYDFNNPASSGCTGGQLSLNVASGTLAGVSGCSTTGLALGTNAAFSQGAVDSLTLATANTSAYIDCAWDITNIPLTQKVPADQASGSYALNLTLTVVAN